MWSTSRIQRPCERPRSAETRRSVQQLFRDLHRIERRAFEQLIAPAPEAQAVVHRAILAHPANRAVVALRHIERQWVTLVRWIVDDVESRRLAENFARRLH